MAALDALVKTVNDSASKMDWFSHADARVPPWVTRTDFGSAVAGSENDPCRNLVEGSQDRFISDG